MIRAIVGRQQMGLTDFLSIVGVDQAQPRGHVLCRLIGVIAQDGKILRARGIYLVGQIQLPIRSTGGLQRQRQAGLIGLQIGRLLPL